jgi:hypothetical protein
MKKLILLLLIAPVIGNSQMLNLPVSEVIIINRDNYFFSVPSGKVLQLISSSYFYKDDDQSPSIYRTDDYAEDISLPRIDECIIFSYPNPVNDNQIISWNNSTIYGYSVIPEGIEIFLRDGDCFDNAYTFVLYDLEAQNLAYNLPQQTTPTLYPNPTSSLLALNSDKEYDIEVYDMAGNKVMALTGNTIDMSHLSSATYIVKALDKLENEEVSYKVVKN